MDTLLQPHEFLDKILALKVRHHNKSSNTSLHHERRQNTCPPQQYALPWPSEGSGGGLEPPEFSFTDQHYVDVLNSMGPAIFIYDLDCTIIYWNRPAERICGYSAAEALGCHVLHLLADDRDHEAGFTIVARVSEGQTWTGQFPVIHKRGGKIILYSTVSPFYDDTNTLVGILSIACDGYRFEGEWPAIKAAANGSKRDSVFARSRSIALDKLGLDPHQPLQLAVTSRISSLVSKLINKMKSEFKKRDHSMNESQNTDCPSNGISNAASYVDREDSTSSGMPLSSFEVFHEVQHPEAERKPGLHKIIASMEGEWIHTKRRSWQWKGSEYKGDGVKTTSFASPSVHNVYDDDPDHENRSTVSE